MASILPRRNPVYFLNAPRRSVSNAPMKKTILTLAVLAGLLTAAQASDQAESTSPEKAAPVVITPIGELRRGTMVTVQGTVERITDTDEFRLSDETGRVRVDVGPNWVPAEVGEKVTVRGFVDDDIGPLEIYARSLTRADGSEVKFDKRYE
jgi:uncharacterized protein YdeI (BOF family)